MGFNYPLYFILLCRFSFLGLYTVWESVCVPELHYCPQKMSAKTTLVHGECRHKQSYLGAMFCTMAVLISSSLPGPILLLLQELLGDKFFPETSFSIAAPAVPLKVTSEIQMGLHDSLTPFPAKVLCQTPFLFCTKCTVSTMGRQISVLPVLLRSLELNVHGFCFF